MSDFLTNLVARTLPSAPSVRPRLPSLYESAPAGGEPGPLEVVRETLSPMTAPLTPSPASTRSAATPDRGAELRHAPVPAAPGDSSGAVERNRGIDSPDANTVAAAPSTGPEPSVVNVPSAFSSGEPVAVVDSIPSPRTADPPRARRAADAEPPRTPGAHTVRPRAMPVARESDRPAATARSSTPHSAPSLASPAPVQVTIGRVEIRAVVTPSRTERPTSPTGQSLDAYLRRRAGGVARS
ncbi:MAG: hypothetical protein JNK85_06410 [Verrucomicrobiales bacterium]|nr:hypothetical protein [Verrucomicrobiales bacterium]